MSVSLAHQQVIVNGIRLHVVTAGPPTGRPVVLLHGFPEFWQAWEKQIGPLAEAGFRVIVPDMRGYNLSEKPPGVASYRLSNLTADIAALIEVLAGGRAQVVGHDWGGIVAWALTMQYPERIERLAILNAPHPGSRAVFLKLAQLKKSWYVLFFQLPWLPELMLSRLGLRALQGTNPAAYTAQDQRAYLAAWSQPGAPAGMVNYYRALLRYGAGPLQVISQPTLVIWGEQDAALLPELADPPGRWVPNVQVERLPQASHWVMRDAPEQVNALLADFLTT